MIDTGPGIVTANFSSIAWPTSAGFQRTAISIDRSSRLTVSRLGTTAPCATWRTAATAT